MLDTDTGTGTDTEVETEAETAPDTEADGGPRPTRRLALPPPLCTIPNFCG
jgi:hypothetical protein